MKKQVQNLILIDSGNLFVKNFIDSEENRSTSLLKANLLFKYYQKLGLNAYIPGERDFLVGIDTLRGLSKRFDIDFVLANVVAPGSGNPVFQPYLMINVEGLKIGLIGVVSEFRRVKIPPGKYQVIDPIVSLKPIVEKFKKEVDLLIVAGALRDGDESRICNNFPEIDLILRGNSMSIAKPIGKVKETYISRVSTKGKYLGRLNFHIKDPEEPFIEVSRIKNRLQYYNNRLLEYSKNIGDKSLEEYYKDRPGTLRVIHNLLKQRDKLKSELKSSINQLEYEIVRMDQRIKDDPEAARDVALLKKKLRRE